MSKAKLQELLKEGNISDTRGESDTIKLWESYRQQAVMWRAIALLQIPATSLAVILAMLLWSTRSITLKVPGKPLPGSYAAQDIPDTEFINFAQDFVSLTSSYQPNIARRQYERAAIMLSEPFLTKFKNDFMSLELKAIETTSRTQIYFTNPDDIKVERDGKNVNVVFAGERLKIVAGQELPLIKTTFTVTINMIPRNPLNPYGLAIVNFTVKEDEKKN